MGLLGNYLNKKTGGKMGSGGGDDGGVAPRDTAGESAPAETGKGWYGSNLTSYHKGGVVKKTGPARLKKGERVLTKTQFKKLNGKRA